MVILISLVALGAGNSPCCEPDKRNRVFFRSAWSHVLTKHYSVIAFRVFALDAIISVYGHVAHLASRLPILRCNQAAEPLHFSRTIKLIGTPFFFSRLALVIS